MAAHSTFPSTRPSQYSWFESITEISILGSTVIDGLGVFGLAANGMCPTLPAETTPPDVGSKPRVGNGPTQ
ncbi:MAG: hypothetical protein ABSE96_15465 [Terracidiphilus sp.]|jgi:hypothetical protein